MSKIGIIVAREFNERVRKKSFIITTILMPVLMLGMMAAPTLMMLFAKGEQKQLVVLDESGVIAPQLTGDEEILFTPMDCALESARADESIFGVLWIGADIVENPNNVKLYTNSSSSMSLEESIAAQIEDVVEAKRLEMYDIEGLKDIMDNLQASVSMTTYRNDLASEGEAEEATSSVVAYLLGLVLGMML